MEWSKALLEGAFIQYGPFFDTLLVFLRVNLIFLTLKIFMNLNTLQKFMFFIYQVFFITN